MRSLTELSAEVDLVLQEAAARGEELPSPPRDHRSDMMDWLMVQAGDYDPNREIAPMKAKDTKDKVIWSRDGNDYSGIKDLFAYPNDVDSARFIMEPKYDGCRVRIFFGATENAVLSGRRSVVTQKYSDRSDNFPHIRDAVVPELAGTILDCELLAPSSQIWTSTPDKVTDSLLNASVSLMNSGPEKAAAAQDRHGLAQVFAFDLIALNGAATTSHTLGLRRRMLEAAIELLHLNVEASEEWAELVPHWDSNPLTIERALEEGLEGVIVKDLSSAYTPGKRVGWWKVKAYRTGDFFISGFEEGENGNKGKVGSVCFSYVASDGSFVEAGKFGNISDELREELSGIDENGDVMMNLGFYGLVVEIMAQARTKTGRLRHAHLVRFRPDKGAADCDDEQIEVFPWA